MTSKSATTTLSALPNKSPQISYRFFQSIEAAGADWDLAAPKTDVFLQRRFLGVVEKYPPEGMRFGYLVFYTNDLPVGVAICQIKYFKADDSLNDFEAPKKDPCFFNSLGIWFKKWVAGWAAADILICGNMLLTGEHGFYFDDHKIGTKEAAIILEKALDEVVDIMGKEGVKMPVILVKDVAPESENQSKHLVKKGYAEFDIQPNMILELPFKSYEAYLAAMSTKYRTRAKRAEKKLQGVVKRELTEAEIEAELPTIYRLYRDIANNAGFNMIDLNQSYILGMKRHFGDHFRVFAYYLDGKLVAFYSTIYNHAEVEAHFLGFEKSLNHDYQLYLNILYDIVRIGIDKGADRIVFARTALEIKSSVGATAHQLWCYLRHQNNLVNKFSGKLLDYLKPIEEWQPRHPFKEEADH